MDNHVNRQSRVGNLWGRILRGAGEDTETGNATFDGRWKMERITITCDGCGMVKGEGNHWWRVYVLIAELQIRPWASPSKDIGLESHFCGSACLQKKLAEWMGKVGTS